MINELGTNPEPLPQIPAKNPEEKPQFLINIDYLGEEEVGAHVANLFSEDPATTARAETGLLAWAGHKSNHDYTRTGRINDFEQALRPQLKEKGQINWAVFKLLAEMEEHRSSVYAHLEILEILSKLPEIFTPEIKGQIKILSESKDLKDEVLLHKICDLLEGLQVTEQFGAFKDDKKAQERVKEIYEFAKAQAMESENFLLSTHWQNVCDTYQGRHAQKSDAILNVPGGASDYIIATYNEYALLQSYFAGILAGKTAFSPEKPLLPVAEGYYAHYDKGRVIEFCQLDTSRLEEAYGLDKKMVERNDHRDNYIYASLNNSSPTNQRGRLSDFLRRVEKQGRNFYFNIINSELDDPSQPYSLVLNPQTIDPETLANILFHNYRYLMENTKLLNSVAESIRPEVFLKKAFPTGIEDPQKGYLYLYMLGLTARKSVEQNLGENLANIPPFGQAALLEFLASRNKKEFERVVKAGDSWGQQDQNPHRQDFLLSFLAINENPKNQEVILALAETLPPEVSSKLFFRYSQIVKASQEIKAFLQNELKTEADARTLEKITNQLFKKANELLNSVYSSTQNHKALNYEDLYQSINLYRSEIAVLASALRNAKGIKLSDVQNSSLDIQDSSQLTEQQKTEMLYAFKANREKLYPGGLKDHTAQEFEKKLNIEGHEFYVYNFKGHPAIFFHVDRESEDTWYVGSLNLGPEAFDSPLAVEVIKSALEQDGGKHNLRAVVYEGNPALKYYTRILGFKITGKEEKITDQAGNTYKYVEVLRPKAA